MIKLIIFLFAFSAFGLAIPKLALAGQCQCCDGTTFEAVESGSCRELCDPKNGGAEFFSDSTGKKTEFKTQCAAVKPKGAVVGLGRNPLCPDPKKPCELPDIIGRVIRAVLGVVGAIALAMFVYGGFLWMTGVSRGEKRIQYAKEVIIWATLGLAVIFASYLLVDFVIKAASQ